MAKKMTNKEFLDKLRELKIDNIDIIGQYINSRTNVVCRCKRCGHIFERLPSVLYETSECPICSKRQPKFTKEEIIEQMKALNNGITMIGEYINVSTPTDFRCDKGHIWSNKPIYIIKEYRGCPYCAGKKVWISFNDIWTTHPDVAQLLKNPEDGYKYSYGSSKRVDFICPNCQSVSTKQISLVCRHGFVCQHCADGVSYPNKFGRAFLDQLPIEGYICEYHPGWDGRKSYDNYFEYLGKQYILEMDGGLHYESGVLLGKTLEERQEIDNQKNECAKINNVNIIRINCSESNMTFIKNNILNSDLSNMFDLSKINWDICDEIAQSNSVKIACKMYSSGERDLQKIAGVLHVGEWTVSTYLQRGAKFGWCDYNPEESLRQSHINSRVDIVLLDNNDNVIKEFNGITNNIEKISQICGKKLNSKGVWQSCQTHKSYKGFNFRYLNEYNTK